MKVLQSTVAALSLFLLYGTTGFSSTHAHARGMEFFETQATAFLLKSIADATPQTVASKGVLHFRVTTHGKAAHSAKPHLGNNAISHMARLVLALEDEHKQFVFIAHPLLGSPTVNVGVIHGGIQENLVPNRCSIKIDRRLLPGETASSVLRVYQALLDRLQQEHPSFDASLESPPLLVDEALDTPVDSHVVRVAQQVLAKLGLDASPCGVPFGSDASKLSRSGIHSILFGPGSIDQAHSVDEYVEVTQVAQAAAFYRQFILDFA